MWFIITIVVIIIIILLVIFYLRYKMKGFLRKNFGANSWREAFKNSEIKEESTPKSLSSMESIYDSKIRKDFPSLNLNELRSEAESVILKAYNSIEDKDKKVFKEAGQVRQFIINKIEDAKNTDTHYSSCKVHRTVLNKYENRAGIATLTFQSSFEYVKRVGNKSEKIQSRMNSMFIYIVDDRQVSKREKTIGLNCPNCGAPLRGVGQRVCVYCGSGTEDIIKRTWVINNIAEV